MNTKQSGDIAEQRVTYELLARGHDVLRPIGDRLPYDVAIDRGGSLVRIQVKLAWRYGRPGTYAVDIRRHQTNRVECRHVKYQPSEFDFLIAWIREPDAFYVFPSAVACSFSGPISMTLETRQRACKSDAWRGAWDLLQATRGVEQPG